MFINPPKHDLGLKIGTLHIGSPTCADDVLLLSKDPLEPQIIVNLQAHFAENEQYYGIQHI